MLSAAQRVRARGFVARHGARYVENPASQGGNRADLRGRDKIPFIPARRNRSAGAGLPRAAPATTLSDFASLEEATMDHRISCIAVLVGSLCFACGSREAPAAEAPPPPPAAAAPVEKPAEKPAAAAPAALTAAALGQAAPDFTLTDSDGAAHTLSQLRGKTVVLEWFNPDCPFAKFAHQKGPLKDMAARVARPDLVWLSINSGAPGKQGHGVERNKQARAEYAIQNAVLLDESGTVGRAYGAQKTPHLFVIDKNGVLVYRGGVDNAPMGEVDPARPLPPGAAPGSGVNYVDAALDDLAHGRAVRLPDTPAYGCAVKYES
jgi:peroxiredoxin